MGSIQGLCELCVGSVKGSMGYVLSSVWDLCWLCVGSIYALCEFCVS